MTDKIDLRPVLGSCALSLSRSGSPVRHGLIIAANMCSVTPTTGAIEDCQTSDLGELPGAGVLWTSFRSGYDSLITFSSALMAFCASG